MTRLVVVLLAAMVVGGCMSAGRFPQLAEADRQLFHRCWPSMKRAACGDDNDTIYVTNCIRDEERKYADRPGKKRGRWLIAHGCPKDMVAAAEEENEEEEAK